MFITYYCITGMPNGDNPNTYKTLFLKTELFFSYVHYKWVLHELSLTSFPAGYRNVFHQQELYN